MPSNSESSGESASPRTEDETLTDWLRDRDAFCPLCNYNVRNLISPRCPECGQLLRLSLALVAPYLKAWIALLVAACAGAGIGILLVYPVARNGLQGAPFTLKLAILGQILMIPVAVLLLIFRRRFQRLPRSMQWLLAALGIGCDLFCYTMYFLIAGLF